MSIGRQTNCETPSARMPMAIVGYSYLIIMNLVNLVLAKRLSSPSWPQSVWRSFRHSEKNVSVAFVMVTCLKSSLFSNPFSSPVQSPGFVPSQYKKKETRYTSVAVIWGTCNVRNYLTRFPIEIRPILFFRIEGQSLAFA